MPKNSVIDELEEEYKVSKELDSNNDSTHGIENYDEMDCSEFYNQPN